MKLQGQARRSGRIVAGAVFGFACLCQAAAAQIAADVTASDLRARQGELFKALSADPANLELMFAYATTSLRLEDYEPAIATLERMLFFNPDLSRVKLELAVAYYRLGVYDVARLHFESVLADDPPEEVAARIAPFLAKIEDRTALHDFSGFLSLGGVYSSNATLGPPDREVRAAFFPNAVAFLSDDAVEKPDVGVRLAASAAHRYDLRRASDDAWITTLDYNGIRYRKEDAGELDAVFLATGPRLALDDEAFGMKGRPYVDIGYVRSAGEPLYAEIGGGFEASNSLTPKLAVFGAVNAEVRDFFKDRDDFDGWYAALSAGIAVTPARGQSLRGAALARTDRTAASYTSNNEVGVRVGATRLVDFSGEPGLRFLERPWRFSLFGQASYRFFDAPDPAVDADKTRKDLDVRLGFRALAPVSASNAVAMDVSYFRRFSNIENFVLKNAEFGLSFIHFF